MARHTLAEEYRLKEILEMFKLNDKHRAVLTIESTSDGAMCHILETDQNLFILADGPMLDENGTKEDGFAQFVLGADSEIVVQSHGAKLFSRTQRRIAERILRNPAIAHFIGQRLLENTEEVFYEYTPYIEPTGEFVEGQEN